MYHFTLAEINKTGDVRVCFLSDMVKKKIWSAYWVTTHKHPTLCLMFNNFAAHFWNSFVCFTCEITTKHYRHSYGWIKSCIIVHPRRQIWSPWYEGVKKQHNAASFLGCLMCPSCWTISLVYSVCVLLVSEIVMSAFGWIDNSLPPFILHLISCAVALFWSAGDSFVYALYSNSKALCQMHCFRMFFSVCY